MTQFDDLFERPADDIPVDPDSARLVANEWQGANLGHAPLNPQCEMGLQPPGYDWGQPATDLRDPNVLAASQVVTRRVFPANGYPGNVAASPRGSVTTQVVVGAQPSDSSDCQSTLILPDGTAINLWGYSAPWTHTVDMTGVQVGQARGVNPGADFLAWIKSGGKYVSFNQNVDLVAGGLEVIPPNAMGNACCQSDVAPAHNGLPNPADVDNGALTQRVGMSVATAISPPAKGGHSVMPSRVQPIGTLPNLPTCVWTGQQFRLIPDIVTPTYISSWCDSRHYLPDTPLRHTATVMATGLVVLGWINTMYGGTAKSPNSPAIIPCRSEPAARDHWRALGISDPNTALHLLDGLIQANNFVALTPPTGILANGKGTTTTNAVVSSFGYPVAA